MAKRSKSVMQDEKRCWATGAVSGLDQHHVFKGSRRKHSEDYGLWIWLRHDVHMALHDHCPPWETLENDLKPEAQRAFEAAGGSREEFRLIFGANYLEDPDDGERG